MGRWSDWDAVVAAQNRAAEEDAARRARKASPRVIRPGETLPEAVAAPEPVDATPSAPSRHVAGGTTTYTDVAGRRVTRPTIELHAEQRAEYRRKTDPVAALRLLAKWLGRDMKQQEDIPPWER